MRFFLILTCVFSVACSDDRVLYVIYENNSEADINLTVDLENKPLDTIVIPPLITENHVQKTMIREYVMNSDCSSIQFKNIKKQFNFRKIIRFNTSEKKLWLVVRVDYDSVGNIWLNTSLKNKPIVVM